MIIRTVSVEYGRKLNLGDYNSAEIKCQLLADIGEEEAPNLHAIMKDLWAMAKENVKAQVAGATAKPNMTLKEYYLGLPNTEVKELEELENADQTSH